MEDGRHIRYSNPIESKELGEMEQHRFDLMIDGEVVGAAEIDYFSKPIPLYQITDVYVDFDRKGRGHASEIMDQVEAFLIKRKKPGVLVDAIWKFDPAANMYAKRGWKKVPGTHGRHVFNWPPDVPLDVLSGFQFRYTDPMLRMQKK